MGKKLLIIFLVCFFGLVGFGSVACAENQAVDLKVQPSTAYPEGKIPDRSETAYYQSVSDALSVAKSGDTIILMEDFQQSASINSGYGVIITLEEITLDLNGKVYQDKKNSINSFQVAAGAKLIIKDNQGTGKITTTKARQCIRIEKGGEVSVFSGSIKNTRTSGIGIENEGTLMMYGGSISGREYGITCIGDPESSENKTEIYDGAVATTVMNAVHVSSGNLSVFGGRFTSIKNPCFVIDDDTLSNICIQGGIYNMDVTEACSQSDCICDENDDPDTVSEYPWKVYPNSTICVTAVCSMIDDEGNMNISETFGSVLGGGSYCKGDKIVLTAPVKEGWEFYQWYKKDNGDWTAVSDEKASTCVMSPDENCLITAGYIKHTVQPLSLHVQGDDYSISGTLSQDGHYNENQDFECEFGAAITLTAGDTTDFQYWMNESGKIVNQSGIYHFIAVQQDTTIKEKVTIESEVSTTIQFWSSYKQLLKESIGEATRISFPCFQPSAVGEIFKSWIFSDDLEIATNEKILQRVQSESEENISIIPNTADSGETCDVILEYPLLTDDSTYAGQMVGQKLDIFPDSEQCPQNKKFAYWTDENQNIMSFADNFQIRAISDKILTAQYLSQKESVSVIPVLAWQDLSIEAKESDVVIHLTAVRSAAEGDEVLDQGILYSDNPDQELMVTETDVSKLISTDLTGNGSFTGHFHYNQDEIESADYLYCRAYAVVCHQSEIYILYAETKAIPLF